ncbi:hypothetical protein [Falsiroseomonas sp.]|uniref:hypothetical protein n=1 Tax=Falsiroseomonas sp. TaxID=2870721 RepID=UPI003F7275EC
MLDRTTVQPPSSGAELDAIMERMRAEIAAQRQAVAANSLAPDVLPKRMSAFAGMSEDGFLEAAFRATLGRSPTPAERELAVWQVRGRMTRAVMLERMLALPEVRARGVRIAGVRWQAFLDRVRRLLRESGVTARLSTLRRVARGLRLLLRAAPRLARIDEALAATRQAAVAEQTQRFTSFVLQQTELQRVVVSRLTALDGGQPSLALARMLAEAAAESTLPDASALALLRGAPGPVTAPGASAEQRAVLSAAGLELAQEGQAAGALLILPGATLATLDALMANTPASLAPGGFVMLPAASDAAGVATAATPVTAASDVLLRRLAAAHRLSWEEAGHGMRLARRAA